MSEPDFYTLSGFHGQPFASTNAGEEADLASYFVTPPYFESVLGDPKQPKSVIVFAPRGAGKTAQKVMVENHSKSDSNFLCISYDDFDISGLKKASDADCDYHLIAISRRIIVAYLILISAQSEQSLNIRPEDKKYILAVSRIYLGKFTQREFKTAIDSIKSLSDRAMDVWNKTGGTVLSLVNAIASRFNIGAVEVEKSIDTAQHENATYHFERLVNLASSFGYSSVYILVDRVDELPITTQDSSASFDFLKGLLLNLPLLELKRVGFKFFLWDQFKDDYHTAGGRVDRVPEHQLDWSADELESILHKRIAHFSNNKIQRFDDLVEKEIRLNYDKLISYVAYGSPRDMIRICQRIVAEHTKRTGYGSLIKETTINRALLDFCVEKSKELYGKYYPDLKRLDDVNFTVTHVGSNIFRTSQQAARAKIQSWMQTGAVAQIGTEPNPGNRPRHKFGIVDPRLAIAVSNAFQVSDAIREFLIVCPECQSLCISTEGESECQHCNSTIKFESAEKLADHCAKPEAVGTDLFSQPPISK